MTKYNERAQDYKIEPENGIGRTNCIRFLESKKKKLEMEMKSPLVLLKELGVVPRYRGMI